MIGILNYGLGNISAFSNIFGGLHKSFVIASVKDDLKGVRKLILPGVGSFDHAMSLFNNSGMRDAVEKMVLNQDVPILGVCVGMQMLADSSEEGISSGLGWIKGKVKKIKNKSNDESTIYLPHMGWNDVLPTNSSLLFSGLESEAKFYFLHSYFFECFEAKNTLATSHYGTSFSSAVGCQNIYGVQFHPEKSHHYGTLLLKNFSEI